MARSAKMTRVHFVHIADTINCMDVSKKMKRRIAASFADSLRRTNSAFNRSRFIEACTKEVQPRKDVFQQLRELAE